MGSSSLMSAAGKLPSLGSEHPGAPAHGNGSGNGAAAATANGAAAVASRAVSLQGAWRLAGLLFIGGAISTIPVSLLLDGSFEPSMYSLTALAAITGLICLVVPWPRVSERWLAAPPVIATLQIAVAVAVSNLAFTYLYFFVALFVALVFPQPRRMAPFLGLVGLALMAPLAYSDEPPGDVLLWALAAGPALVLAALVVGRLTAGLEESREVFRRLSTEDGLTGVGNYRSLIERLRHETARHARRGREFAVLTLDLNDFKTINETQGHMVGDLVLAIVGSMLDLKVRTEDTVFRQGGDEFSVVAPETDRAQAERLAGRIESSISRISSGEHRLSASVGCAVFPEDGADPGELLDAADSALLWEKRDSAAERRVRPRVAA
jgi:diguanylate cyclase (GGDEF)-like protein